MNLHSNPEKTAVLLLAHGSPDSVEEVPDFLLRVTGGRPLPPPIVDEVKHRYGLIGRSPLTELTLKQGEELELPVYVGMRNWKPFIADALRAMTSDGIQHAVAICLAPQNSRTSVGLYRSELTINRETSFTIDFVDSWHDHPLLIKAFAEKLRAGWDRARREAGTQNLPIIFTAHSVPERTIAEDWAFAFQSQGMSGGAWLGPRVEDTILGLKEKGHRAVFLQPIGFLCDHVEVLYDIDIGFKKFAETHGMRLWRAESLNDSALLAAALADVARTRLAQLSVATE